MISASPSVNCLTPAGRLVMLGSFATAAATSPNCAPASSTSNVTLRLRFRRSMTAGPPAISSVATWLSMTGPRAPGTARRPSNSRSWRAESASFTTIGTCRWLRLSLASEVS